MRLKNNSDITSQNDTIPLDFIGFIVSNEEYSERFFSMSGLTIGDLKTQLHDPVFQGFLLDYALMDESLILAFSADRGLAPDAVIKARRKLPGAEV